MDFLCIENIPSSIFLSYPPVRTTGGFLFCRFSVGRAAPRCKSAANVLLLLLVSSAAFCAGIIWNVSLYSTVKRKRKYFAKINTLQSPRCTGGGIAVRGGRAGLSVCTGSIDYFCFRPDGYAGAGCQPERPGRIQRSRAGAAGHCGGSGFYCTAAVVAAARHPAANAGSAHSAARPLEPGVLPGGVFGAGQRGQPVRRAAGPWAGRYHQQHRAARRWPRPVHSLFQSVCSARCAGGNLFPRGAAGHYAPQRQQRGDFCPCPAVCVAAPGSGTKHYRAGVRHLFGLAG